MLCRKAFDWLSTLFHSKLSISPARFLCRSGHTTGSTTSTWGLHWTHLYFWTTEHIAAEFNTYWNSTVTTQDKNELIAHRIAIDWYIRQFSSNQQQPATDESRIPEIFDRGISWIHRVAISTDNNQIPPSDPHSTIQIYQNVVFGEPDYLLRNPRSFEVKGLCEAT